ncbi:MAG: hypothetical protein ACT4OF_02340 [Caulobacteraceae bacterium]
MRLLLPAAALTLSACGQTDDAARDVSACARSATHEVTWTSEAAPDVITTRAEGPSCSQAVVMFVARNANGDALWAFASTYYDMTAGGVPPEGAPPVSTEDVDRFLAGWANVTTMRSSELPEWREDAATLTESATTFAYETPFERDVYEMLRARNLPMICYAAAVEASQCLIIDPASHAPAIMVAYGP